MLNRGRILAGALLGALTLGVESGRAVVPAPAEFQRCRQWLAAFVAESPGAAESRLRLVSEDVADSVATGRSWRGTPFQLGERTYPHGLAFNARKRIRVELDRPGDRFTADVGVENNDDTRRGAEQGNGSVTFHVWVGGREAFRSPVRRLKDGPESIDVALEGARQFEIEVGDGGDGRGWDQALWAGAEIRLQDGTRLRLQDLPWVGAGDPNPARVSFRIDDRPSAESLKQWTRTARTAPLAGGPGEQREVIFRDPASGVELTVTARVFGDFPAVEWVARIRNGGTQDSPLLEQIRAFDTAFALPGSGRPNLHWARGGVASFDDFAPRTTELQPGKAFGMAPADGRSSSEVLPFFNLEGAGGGVVLALGWSGGWSAAFEASAKGEVRVQAGMSRTRLRLKPGEEIRTPSGLALFYEGDRWRGQNLLRQFILKHHRPQRNGQPLVAPITCGNWGGTRAEVHLDNIAKVAEHRLPLEYYWIDAEWYGTGSWPVSVGDWKPKRDLYPEGFQPLSKALRATGRELMLWFEPERVFRGTPWQKDHAAWLLNTGGDNSLFDLGNPEALAFLTGFVSDRVEEFGLGCYRQDFNMDPAPYWRKADAPERQGMAEIRHIEGLYAYWDGLLRRHPNLILDNCASGGRRIDLETVGRATPFWRTDGPRDAIAHQCHTYGLLMWVPFSATSQDRASDDYEFRSSMCSALCLNWWVSGDVSAERIRADFPFDWARRILEQYVSIRDCYEGDYYPLTSYSQARDVWMAYQLDRPDRGDGLVVVLRRPDSPYESARLLLHELAPEAVYQVTHLDGGAPTRMTGRQLAVDGLSVTLPQRPGSALIRYRREP